MLLPARSHHLLQCQLSFGTASREAGGIRPCALGRVHARCGRDVARQHHSAPFSPCKLVQRSSATCNAGLLRCLIDCIPYCGRLSHESCHVETWEALPHRCPPTFLVLLPRPQTSTESSYWRLSAWRWTFPSSVSSASFLTFLPTFTQVLLAPSHTPTSRSLCLPTLPT